MSKIMKITRKHRGAYFEMPTEHFHSEYELYYLVSGKRRIFLNNKIYHVKEGDMILIPKGEIHRTSYESKEEHERVALSFSKEYVSELIDDIGWENFMSCFERRQITIPANRRSYLEELFDKLILENEKDDEISKALCIRYCEEVLLFIIRCQKYNQFETPQEVPDKEMEAAAIYISQHYKENISLTKLAKMSCMSDSYFSRRFKSATGFGYKEYLNTVRIRHACELLLTTDKSITEIALDCGYMDSNYFGDAFRKCKHISPSQYRKTNLI